MLTVTYQDSLYSIQWAGNNYTRSSYLAAKELIEIIMGDMR